MKLKDYEEIVGTLESYKQEDDQVSLVFKINKIIKLPKNVIQKEELVDCINRRISIFNDKGDYRLTKFPRAIEKYKVEECTSCGKKDRCSKDGLELYCCLLEKINKLSTKKNEEEEIKNIY